MNSINLIIYTHIFIIIFLLSLGFCFLFVRFGDKLNFVSKPKTHSIHLKPVAIGGGIAIYISFMVGCLMIDAPRTILVGATLFFLIGLLDDFANLKGKSINPITRLFLQFVSIVLVIYLGLGVEYVTNPFGGVFVLPKTVMNMITIMWILTCVNAVNFLDGIDGLASGVVAIASVTMIFLTLIVTGSPLTVTLIAIILFLTVVPYIVFNFNPAKLYMDDSGSYLLGFVIGALSMESGGRMATAFLVLGLPLIDLLSVVIKRWYKGVKTYKGDKTSHIHHLLLNKGVSVRKITVGLWLLTISIGLFSLMLNTGGKIILAIFYTIAMVSMSFYLDNTVDKNFGKILPMRLKELKNDIANILNLKKHLIRLFKYLNKLKNDLVRE